MAERDGAPVRVLFVVGSGRSGSTLITTILGQLPGCFGAGELRYLWSRGAEQDHVCGCGDPFSRCPVWRRVMTAVDECGGPVDPGAIGRRLLRRLRARRLPRLLARRALGAAPVPPHEDDERIRHLYGALARHAGARVVVDSSKLPPYALLLEQQRGIELTVLHLVRDPRATAFSWLRRKQSRHVDDGALMQRQQVVKSSVLWMLWNLLAALLWRERDPGVVRLRYEEFVADPRRSLAAIVEAIGEDPAFLPFVDEPGIDEVGDDEVSVTLGPTHAVAGNPNRRDTGTVRLQADLEWQSSMPRRDQVLVTLLTAPGLLRFGYPLRWPERRSRPTTRV